MLGYVEGRSLLSLISDVTATRKGWGHEINSHTSVFTTSWLNRCLGSGHPYGCGYDADGRVSNASALFFCWRRRSGERIDLYLALIY